MSLSLDAVFGLLEAATKLKKEGGNDIDAGTKYFEAVYLMKSYVQRLPPTEENDKTKALLYENIEHYTKIAQKLVSAGNQQDLHDAGSRGRGAVAQHGVSSLSPRATLVGFSSSSSQNRGMGANNGQARQQQQRQKPKLLAFQRFFSNGKNVNGTTKRANEMLAQAIDLDENGDFKTAIQAYMGCAELYLSVIKDLEEQGNAMMKQRIVGRLDGALDRVEVLKTYKGNRVMAKQGSASASFRNLTAASSVSSSSSSSSAASTATLTRTEIELLKRSSLIASGVFLPWSDEDAFNLSKMARVNRHGTPRLFTDPAGELKLADKQLKRFHRWARPSEIVNLRDRYGIKQRTPVMIRQISPYTIRQQYVTDCSFIASLCICANGFNRQSLITSIIYPQDADGQPMYNPSGQYMVKLWLNGVARQVIVDDKLPVDKHGNLLCSETSGSKNQLELWVPIIEKAYMKLCGGYDFPGSNSGIDLFSLTGWIPERIFFPSNPPALKDHETDPERAWVRLYSASSFGDCLITVSTTNDLVDADADRLGLVTGHAYAVLSVVQSKSGVRLLQMKNPWASKGWTGAFSSHDSANWNKNNLRHEVGYNPDEARKHDDGVFWIEWSDVLRYFKNMQLSWNPRLFPFRVTTHQMWEKERGTPEDTFDVGENPQYILSFSDAAIKKKATAWILLSRHVTKQEQQGCEVDEFLTMHLVRNSSKRERIWLGQDERTLVHGAYTNNSHVLACYDASGPEDAFISIVLSQYQKTNDMGYTLSVMCTEPFTLVQPQKDLPPIHDISSQWTAQSAGGPTGQDAFFNNPMYLIDIKDEKDRTAFQARCTVTKVLPVHLMLVRIPSQGGNFRQAVMKSGRMTIESGSYRHGFTLTKQTQLGPGRYALIVSNFHKGETGSYQLKICSNKAIKVAVIP